MIGIFDSGVGGLCALAAVRHALPQADLLYYADQANLPYGEKDPDTLLRLSLSAVELLRAEGADVILAACGTASAVALPRLRERCTLPLFGVVTPAAQAAEKESRARGGGILLLGTHATLKSGAFAAEIHRFATHAPLYTLSCPFFVQLAETGHTAQDDPFAALCTTRILAPVKDLDVRVVVLGCTHFSHLAPLICRALPHTRAIDAAREAAASMAAALPQREREGRGEMRLLTSGDPLRLRAAACRLLPSLFGEDGEKAVPVCRELGKLKASP